MIIRVGIPYIESLKPDSKKMVEEITLFNDSKNNCFGVGVTFQLLTTFNVNCLLHARNKLIYDVTCNPRDYRNFGKWTQDWKAPYDYFLSMDDDNYLPIDDILRMVEESRKMQDKGCFAAASIDRWNENQVIAGNAIDSGDNHCMTKNTYTSIRKFPYRVEWAGCGTMLIPKRVLDFLPIPVFVHKEQKHERKFYSWYSDDQCFALLCKQRGIPIYLTAEQSTHRELTI
jgi:hypothetical protein